MKKTKKEELVLLRSSKLCLFAILILAALLRFWRLGKAPPSPDWDEAALGYNAYSILKTGKDEYGQFLPLILRSFDDYKPAIYAYLIIPFIKLFGLNIIAVRLPSALLGILAVFATFICLKEVFKNSKYALNVPLAASFLLAISPWHLQFSRVAFESSIGLFFNILLTLFFLKGLKKPAFLIAASFTAGLNIYVYQAEKIFTPLLVIALVLIFHKELLSLSKKYLAASFVAGVLLLMPFIFQTFTTPEIFLRAKGTSITADQTPFLARTVEKLQRDYQNKDYLGLLFDNRRVTYLLAFVSGYLAHFDLNWLFLTGDEARHHAPGMGLLYLWELPFLFFGFYSLIFSKISLKSKILVFSWFFIAPIPASFTSGVPHAVRTIRFMPMIQVFVSLGLIEFCQYFCLRRPFFVKCLISAFLLSFFLFNFAYFLNQYFVQQNYFNSQQWQFGYQEAVGEVNKIAARYQKIVISNQPHLDQSYMFFLFYLKFDPLEYQKSGGTVSGGFAETHKGFGKFTFRPIKWETEEKTPQVLYVGRPGDFPENVKLIKTIYFLDGQPAIKIVEG